MTLSKMVLLGVFSLATVIPLNAEDSNTHQRREWQHKIIPLERDFYIDEKRGFIKVSGHWERAITHSKYPKLRIINSTEISCLRRNLECTEIVAQVDAKHDGSFAIVDGQLWAAHRTYKIIEWSPTRVVAQYDALVAEIQIRIFLDNKTADRLHREKENPNVIEQWILK